LHPVAVGDYNGKVKFHAVNLDKYRNIGASSGEGFMQCSAIDSSGNIWFGGQTRNNSSGTNQMFLAKYDSSGTLLNSYYYTCGGSSSQINYILIDSSNNLYLVGFRATNTGSGQDTLVAKVDSSGNILWSSALNVSGSGGFELFYSAALDASNNIYCSGFGVIAPGYGGIIAKYNSSGTLQWQRTVKSSSGDTVLTGIRITSDNANMIVSGGCNAPNFSEIDLYLPTSGAGAGTSGIITYAASSLVENTGVASLSSGTTSSTTAGFTSYTTTAANVTPPTNVYSKTSI
jgi:hypothetical protein